MPNRILKESICTSENIDQLTPFQESFFYRLMVNCDDYGRFDARPKILASKLYPLRNLNTGHVTEALKALQAADLIVLYEVDGHAFLQMKTWDRHQQIRAKRSKFPAYDSRCNQMISDDSICPRNPIQSNPIRNPNPNPNPTRARETQQDDDFDFDVFWRQYPNKVAKQDALKAWRKLKPDEQMMIQIMAGLKKWIASDEWKRENGRFIPHPSTWLNGRRWEDEVRKAEPVSGKASVKRVLPAQDFEQRNYDDVPQDDMARLAAEMRRAREAGEFG